MQQYVPPEFKRTAFNCPHCGAFAEQEWVTVYVSGHIQLRGYTWPPKAESSRYVVYDDMNMSVCYHCRREAVWYRGRLTYPDYAGVVPPNPDLSDEIKRDYLEAASIVQRSPRGAAALLRLSIQKLCVQLGLSGKDINNDIGTLVRQGLPVQIQQALDIVRVVGNEAVHPGELDMRDDIALATKLFELINLIADNRLSEPKRIDALFQALPEKKREGIEQRDNKDNE